MTDSTDFVADVADALDPETKATFERRVREQAERIREDVRTGRLDTAEFAVGLELEAYVVDGDGRLAPVPDAVFEQSGCAKELGLHNVEVNTPPSVLDVDGVSRQSASVRERVDAVRRALADHDLELVLDGMWTVPPAEGTEAYLGAVREEDGVVVAENMRPDPRYCALDNEVRRRVGGDVPLDLPGIRREFPSILVESLTTSIQPHLQIPSAEAFPRYFNAAVRTTGPLLSLCANSPFLPADLYADADPRAVVAETSHELRVPVFEESINAGVDADARKVRLPRDVDAATDVVDRIAADETYAPALAESAEGDEYRDGVPEFDHKRGTYWRWVRGVVGGAPVGSSDDGASLRIEYRPLPTQPTVTDVLATCWLTVGLVRGLVAADHPVLGLDWADARDGFYAAVREGPHAEIPWVTAEGDRTTDRERMCDEVFAFAERGLVDAGMDADAAAARLDPVAARETTPSEWKRRRVAAELDAGATLPDAIRAMQGAYRRNAATGDPFAAWDYSSV
ncbi:MAG: hypothetical protein ABEJ90_01235 [Halobacterium sp.]